jgi:predicted DNA-binding protein (MmcQ/YjbR family)
MIEREGCAPAPYVGRYNWIGVETLDTLPPRELEELIARSYEMVVAKLPKKKAQQTRLNVSSRGVPGSRKRKTQSRRRARR